VIYLLETLDLDSVGDGLQWLGILGGAISARAELRPVEQ
jgi:hypothetical protein